MTLSKHVTRRRLMMAGTVALAMPALPRWAKAAEYALKLGHSNSPDHPFHLRMVEVAEQIKTQTGGRATLAIFPANQLGSDNDLLSQVRSGAIDFCQPTGQILSSLLPVTATNAMGFVWSSYDQVWPAMDGDLGAYIRGQIATKTRLVAMPRMWDLGFRQITTSNRPIHTVGDLANLKLRVPVAPSLVSLFTALGAAPAGIQYGELYAALQTRVVDGQENPLAQVAVSKLYEVQKYISMTNHVWDAYWICGNGRMWGGLPADLQTLIADCFDVGALKERADLAQINISVKSDLQQRGMIVNDAAPDSFRTKLHAAGFYKEWRGRLGEDAWALLEKHVGRLT